MSRARDLPFAVWVLIGFAVSFLTIGGGVLLARSGDDGGVDGEGQAPLAEQGEATTTTVGTTTSVTEAPPSTTTTTTAAPATTAAPGPTEPAPGVLTVGEPRGFEWPDPDHPPFPFPAPAEVRGRVEEHDRPETYAFTLEIEERDATVEDVVAHLERFPAAAGWTATEAGGASFAFERDCGSGCRVEVRLDVSEPDRRNRGPQLEVVVTFDGS